MCKTDSAGKPLSIIAMISDSCPECEADHIDVQSLAFAKVGGQAGGGWVAAGWHEGQQCRCSRAAVPALASAPPGLCPPHAFVQRPSGTIRPSLLLLALTLPQPLRLPPVLQLADPGIGRINMQYRRVECAPPEPMQVCVWVCVGVSAGGAGRGAGERMLPPEHQPAEAQGSACQPSALLPPRPPLLLPRWL